ncbi:hypothetical protein SBA4_5010007 [Candidatus Sulfopaludibacter sp. SbA4]|nr:hypothetical protein SBA4_5010007 [Candidatus Sulfopaludibacter sp. SbA4]
MPRTGGIMLHAARDIRSIFGDEES